MRGSILPRAAAILLLATAPCFAATIVLDGDDVLDWSRVMASTLWPQKDASLHPNALLKFGLDDLPGTAPVLQARLLLFVERTTPGVELSFFLVGDDSWSYPPSFGGQDHFAWPTVQLLGSVACPDTMTVSIDVTAAVAQELGGDGVVSFKIESAGGVNYPDVRLASPLGPLAWRRPRLVVDLAPGVPLAPDLALHDADLRMSPRLPAPGSFVTLRADVWNLGTGDAGPVSVSFYDGDPSAGLLIGSAAIPAIPGGGARREAAVGWTCSRGDHEIHAVAALAGGPADADPSNNAALRVFTVAQPLALWRSVESFEGPGLGPWRADFEVPPSFQGPFPLSWHLVSSGAEAYHGSRAVELSLDGTQDDGTIWLEREIPVEPGSVVTVRLGAELFRYQPDMAYQPVVAVSPLDPENEYDFTVLPSAAVGGWEYLSYQRTVDAGPYDTIHLALGLTVTWETWGTFFYDLLEVAVQGSATAVPAAEPAATPPALGPGVPNPANPAATIAFALPRPGPVKLAVYDARGALVATLHDGWLPAGPQRARWDGRGADGRPAASGVYLYRLEAPGVVESRKLLLVR